LSCSPCRGCTQGKHPALAKISGMYPGQVDRAAEGYENPIVRDTFLGYGHFLGPLLGWTSFANASTINFPRQGLVRTSAITPASVTAVRRQVVAGSIRRERMEIRVLTLEYENAEVGHDAGRKS